MKKIAREYFMQRRGNCAQSVAAAWSEKPPAPPDERRSYPADRTDPAFQNPHGPVHQQVGP